LHYFSLLNRSHLKNYTFSTTGAKVYQHFQGLGRFAMPVFLSFTLVENLQFEKGQIYHLPLVQLSVVRSDDGVADFLDQFCR
jgi:hypothetical protein